MPSVESIRESLYPVFSRYRVKKAILFGSFAKGTARESSDIDIFVDSGLKGLQFFGLLEDVTACFAKPVDLIDASQITANSRVMEEIDKNGVLLYESRIGKFC